MKLLVDSQLPAALARWVSANGLNATHVSDIGLHAASDREIWTQAREKSLIIVTKDEDFRILANHQRSIPPQVVWVRLGNCRKQPLLSAFGLVLPALIKALDAGESIVEIR